MTAVVAAMAVFAALLLPLPASAQTAGYKNLERGSFVIQYTDADKRTADMIATDGPVAAKRLEADLGLDRLDTVTIFIAADAKDYQEALGGKGTRPEWSAGVAYPSKSLIVLSPPRTVQPNGDRIDIFKIFVHELCHVLLQRALNDRVPPDWLAEGLAKVEAGEWSFDMATQLTGALLMGRLIPLHDLIHSFPGQESRARLAYAESMSFVSYLMTQTGVNGFQTFLARLAKGESMDSALRLTTGKELFDLEQDWRSYLLFHHTLISILGRSGFWWFLAAVLAFLAYLTVKIRSRRRLREMEIEERRYYGDDEFHDPERHGPGGWVN